jgi:uncharacterized membrane protein YtjA (UPF0391 family)
MGARAAVGPSQLENFKGVSKMIKWAIVFAVISVVAGIFGFSGLAAGSASIAKFLFVVALIIFVALLIAGIVAGKKIAE